jgi:predicted ester cyclase
MSTSQNKALVTRFLDEVYNKGNLDVADELVTANYLSHNELNLEVLGPEGIKSAAIMQRSAFPDLVTTIDDLIAEGDKVVVRGHDEGTHQGEFMGLPPSGARFMITWIDIFRIKEGKLVEAWLETNVDSFKRQLGSS